MISAGAIYIGRKASAKRANDPDVRALLREYLQSIHEGTGTVLLEELDCVKATSASTWRRSTAS
jgi:hypothetical protein